MTTTAILELSCNEEIHITKRDSVKKTYDLSFTAFGGNPGGRNPTFPELFKVFGNLSKPAQNLWWDLVNGRNYLTNQAMYKAASKIEEQKITKAYKELYELHLTVRIKRQHYLLNPAAIFPAVENYTAVQDNWNKLKGDNNVVTRAVP